MNKPWTNRFYFDLFKTGQVAACYRLPVRNGLTGDILFDGNHEEGHPVTENNERKPVTPIGDAPSRGAKIGVDTSGVKVIWDVPEYLEVDLEPLAQRQRLIKVRQYKGYLIHLTPFKNLDDFLAKQLSSRNRKKLRSKKRKLEAEYKVRYAFHYGDIEEREYHRLFDAFYGFLEARFEEKEMVNNNLGKWEYYRELVYPMIREKKASLFVIYADEKPVTIAMQFHLSRTVFSFVQSYDLEFSQYNMGDISGMKRLEWCFEQGFDTYDLSMGETDYKLKWCNHPYDLYFHVFYDSGSSKAVLKSRIIIWKLRLKQYLRDKDILGKMFKLDKFKYWLRNLRASK